MVHRKHSRDEAAKAEKSAQWVETSAGLLGKRGGKKKLEVVLKCDSFGTCEAVSSILKSMTVPDVELDVIHTGVGPVSKTDLLMALTGSKLVVGFSVGIMPKLDQWVKDRKAEVRLYNVIYRIIDDVKKISQSLTAKEVEPDEKILGRARVIALFKSSHKGIILGCEIQEGTLAAGKNFRVISAMGPIYTGRIESLQVEHSVVREATAGQQVGIKITGFNRAKIGDLIESFESTQTKRPTAWEPSGTVLHLES